MQVFSLEEAGGQSKLAEENHPAQRHSLTKCNDDDNNDDVDDMDDDNDDKGDDDDDDDKGDMMITMTFL